MHVGCQNFKCTQAELEFLARHGVTHMDAQVPRPLTLKNLVNARRTAAAYGISLDMIHVLPSRAITEGRDPERDRDIVEFNRWIEIAGRAGLRGLNYSFEMVAEGHADGQSTAPKLGRGGSSYRSFDLSQFDNDRPVAVTRDEVFARMQYFLERVIPTAERWKVQLACHPDDPPAPVLEGVEKWGWPVHAGYERFCALVDSPFHGLNLCCGTTAQGLTNPQLELVPLVRHYAQQRKIFNIHFRNITGGESAFVTHSSTALLGDMYVVIRVDPTAPR
eukprot:COSAG05_NODE_3545_length_1999_cov_1.900000_1_plen_276_part_00